jgi:hypothetical protein
MKSNEKTGALARELGLEAKPVGGGQAQVTVAPVVPVAQVAGQQPAASGANQRAVTYTFHPGMAAAQPVAPSTEADSSGSGLAECVSCCCTSWRTETRVVARQSVFGQRQVVREVGVTPAEDAVDCCVGILKLFK